MIERSNSEKLGDSGRDNSTNGGIEREKEAIAESEQRKDE
jgi:hypothetical protein